ncbi:MAG: hypothetical protein K9J06_05850 [Flavobacteriales bacterium]|nr:hypothetical protein [Flavobacteriales bacterium]
MLTLFLTSCLGLPGPDDEDETSEFGDDESHHNGETCMNCHTQGGSGEGWFTVAGSVERNAGHSLIEFYRSKNGPRFLALEVDGEGNFYTTDPVDFGDDGVFVGIRTGNKFEWMEDDEDELHPDVGPQGQIYYGSCNTCHGVTTDRIERAD